MHIELRESYAMNILKRFKFQEDIDELTNNGILLPCLSSPVDLDGYRFAFESENINNHKPVYKQDPKRLVSAQENNKLTTSGYALSCFENDSKAILSYESICKIIKLFPKTAGDSLFYGKLIAEDGLVTDFSTSGHYDLYEYNDFEPSLRFLFKEKLR